MEQLFAGDGEEKQRKSWSDNIWDWAGQKIAPLKLKTNKIPDSKCFQHDGYGMDEIKPFLS